MLIEFLVNTHLRRIFGIVDELLLFFIQCYRGQQDGSFKPMMCTLLSLEMARENSKSRSSGNDGGV